MGKLLLDSGRYKEAVSPLKKAAENVFYREAYKAWTNLGILEFREGHEDRAQVYFEKAIRDSPSLSCLAYYYQGNIQLNKNQFSNAIKDYGLATKRLCASFGEAHFALGLAYERSRDFIAARKKFVEIQKLYPNTKLAEKAFDQLKFLP